MLAVKESAYKFCNYISNYRITKDERLSIGDERKGLKETIKRNNRKIKDLIEPRLNLSTEKALNAVENPLIRFKRGFFLFLLPE